MHRVITWYFHEMKKYRYIDPWTDRTLTEDEIIQDYWDWWTFKMHEVGKESEISRELCIEDWITTHWAWEVFD